MGFAVRFRYDDFAQFANFGYGTGTTMKLSAFAAAWFIATAAFADAGAVVGRWYSEGRESKIEITEKDGAFGGRIVWLAEPLYEEGDPEAGKPKHDRNNPDKARRADPIIGLVILTGFTYDADAKKWSGGKIYDPNNGKTYSCEMRIEGDALKVRGYVGIPTLGRTTEWTRVSAEDEEKDKTTGASLDE